MLSKIFVREAGAREEFFPRAFEIRDVPGASAGRKHPLAAIGERPSIAENFDGLGCQGDDIGTLIFRMWNSQRLSSRPRSCQRIDKTSPRRAPVHSARFTNREAPRLGPAEAR